MWTARDRSPFHIPIGIQIYLLYCIATRARKRRKKKPEGFNLRLRSKTGQMRAMPSYAACTDGTVGFWTRWESRRMVVTPLYTDKHKISSTSKWAPILRPQPDREKARSSDITRWHGLTLYATSDEKDGFHKPSNTVHGSTIKWGKKGAESKV